LYENEEAERDIVGFPREDSSFGEKTGDVQSELGAKLKGEIFAVPQLR